jgi:flavodoxin
MAIHLVYHSLTGNTRKVAEAMATELAVQPIAVKDVDTGEIQAGDLLFLGDGVYWNRPSRPMRRFVKQLRPLQNIKVALFGTYGGWPHQLDWMVKRLQQKGAEILGRFSCKGRDWAFLGLIARNRPSQIDLKAATTFAAQMQGRVEKSRS